MNNNQPPNLNHYIHKSINADIERVNKKIAVLKKKIEGHDDIKKKMVEELEECEKEKTMLNKLLYMA